jgi:hypothetical protein
MDVSAIDYYANHGGLLHEHVPLKIISPARYRIGGSRTASICCAVYFSF